MTSQGTLPILQTYENGKFPPISITVSQIEVMFKKPQTCLIRRMYGILSR